MAGGFLSQIVLVTWMACYVVLKVNGEVINVGKCDRHVRRGDGVVCYNVAKTQGTFDVAEHQCEGNGQTLLSIASSAESDVIKNLLTENSLEESWVGAVQKETNWQWLDGSEIYEQGCFMDNVDAPDMVVYTILSGNNAAECSSYCSSLSFKYAALEAGSQCRCGNDFGSYGQNSSCSMNCPGGSSEICGGPLAERVLSINGGFSNWFPGQPNNVAASQACAIMDSNSDFQWNDVECSELYGAVCEIFPSNQFNYCDTSVPGVHIVNNLCIYVIETPMTYFDARLACHQSGGDLINLKSQAVSAQLVGLLLTTPSGYWIGLSKYNWNWIASGDAFFYTNWFAGQPGLTTNCATVKRDNAGQWFSADCTSIRFFICQSCNTTSKDLPVYPHTTTTSTTTSTTPLPTVTYQPGYPNQPGYVDINSPTSNKIMPDQTQSTNSIPWAVIGGVIGGAVFLIIFVIVVIVCCCKKFSKKTEEKCAEKGEGTTVIEPTYFFGIDYETETGCKTFGKINQPDVVESTTPTVVQQNSDDRPNSPSNQTSENIYCVIP